MEILSTLDWVVIALYFLVIAGIAAWSMKKKKESTEDYFLAGRNIGWFVVGASILASNVGSEHVVGLSGTAAETGVIMGHYELHSWIVLLLGWVFIPFYIRSGVFTMPEFLERRYNSSARWFLSVVSLLSYVITKVSVTVYAGAVVIATFMGFDFWTSALVLVVLTGIYTVLGGMKAVVYTETLQAILLIVGSAILTVLGLIELGGWDAMIAATPKEKLNMFPPLSHPEFPWAGILFASPIVGIWYWCTDQYIVQRCLTAKNEQEARRGTIFAAYLKLFPFFIFLVPGLIATALVSAGKLELTSADSAFPTLVKTLLPAGLRGLIAGGLLAALMSSLASVFNSCSTLFTMDIYKKVRPESSEKKLVAVGRIATGVVVILGILWIPVMSGISGVLYHYLQSVQSYLAPPIASVFLLGLFYKRINAKGAMVTLITGAVIGFLRIILELNKSSLSGLVYEFANLNFLYFCILLFVFSVVLLLVVSLLTDKPSEQQIQGLTYATIVAEDREKTRASWTKSDVVLSVIVLFLIAAIFMYFSPIGVGG
ncbi:SSS sodium solute transporter superfamily protein [Chryseotalea sanaruensis]|uniref:SSS sodium solute transporter superfamily protein n=1 Tax=Chryseotalea sanaruensis TaxID=2482724 RepID=A0A401U678_9BACT|nr:sodium:solute symporter [Chryseotalea sanaruensis]GCC50306.1 SSS sodium solute transporter superfamily protein [Chryseotalea sanaruensis]